MIRKVHADKANKTVTLEMTESDLSNIIDSIDNMVDKQQRTLLENLPAEDRVRSKLDSYKALREDLRKVWEGIV
ncbi:MAG: hypothetical protein QOA19_10650 [Nitrososphaeraceae archaeon]|jgi:hypothetical protein|nr:hypothetical protein [Nitrososphaeraceae archaeon]MDW0180039.1 hypothetical protein [Nitrososphaeraceae archaeon]MDW0187974.1 hypothetical protein [Nitrososphaeraceae archaeon]MDW0192255.1 hypothetical protein [Nitrososphaeraceae archaeon]MDW0194684.1 hypothetical protein [Nitrososphaeraceae archaeon]